MIKGFLIIVSLGVICLVTFAVETYLRIVIIAGLILALIGIYIFSIVMVKKQIFMGKCYPLGQDSDEVKEKLKAYVEDISEFGAFVQEIDFIDEPVKVKVRGNNTRVKNIEVSTVRTKIYYDIQNNDMAIYERGYTEREAIWNIFDYLVTFWFVLLIFPFAIAVVSML